MEIGSICIMDALGIKGIWKTVSPHDVISKFEIIKRKAIKNANNYKEIFNMTGPTYDIQIRIWSDTILITVNRERKSKSKSIMHSYIDISICSMIASSVVVDFIELSGVKIFLRGAISYGEYILSKDNIIGPAIDEAAYCSEMSKGAIVWLTPSANKIVSSMEIAEINKLGVLFEYPVSLSNGNLYKTYAINLQSDNLSINNALHEINSFMSGSLEIEIKKQITSDYFKSTKLIKSK
jgi:hypothetical protein